MHSKAISGSSKLTLRSAGLLSTSGARLARVCEMVHRSQALTKAEHVVLLECLRNQVRWYAILESSGHVLSPDRAEEIIKVADAFLRGQNAISMIYWDRKVKLHKVTFKSHLLSRLCF